jgi:hypothetical protein
VPAYSGQQSATLSPSEIEQWAEMMIRGTAGVTIEIRANFAEHHLRAAAEAALRTHDIEAAGNAKTLGAGFDEITTTVPVAICMSGAALEANANELILDVLDDAAKTVPLSVARKVLLQDLLEDRSGNALDRYNPLALILDKVPDKGNAIWGDADLLIRIRNYFMHFKPAWEPTGEDPQGLAKTCKNKFTLAEPYLTSQFSFPHACLTYNLAKWSIVTVLGFSKYISSVLGRGDRLNGWKSPKPLP